jgi:transcriptional regulator with XRE-family HTH domain
MPTFETFGQRLRRLRLERGFSYRDFAKRVRIADSTISLYQNGSRYPGFWVLCEMAKVLDVPLDYLMLGKEYEKGNYPVVTRGSADGSCRLVVPV